MNDCELMNLIDALVAAEGGFVCGPLHIVVEDCNVRDRDLEYAHVAACREGDDLGRLVAAALYRRAPDERRVILGYPEEYAVDGDGEKPRAM